MTSEPSYPPYRDLVEIDFVGRRSLI